MEGKTELNVAGPFRWTGDSTIFNVAESRLSGLYIFSIKMDDSYLIEYVGITTRSFFDRLSEHAREFLSGGYKIYKTDDFSKGARTPLWHGRFGRNKEKNISKFLSQYDTLAPIILKQLEAYYIFLIPIKNKRIAERTEGAMYKILKQSNLKIVREFIDSEVRYKIRKPDEKSIKANINSQYIFLGLPNEFLI